MEQDFFTNLPPEIKLEILSRLPIGSVFKCKLVDRSWRSLIESHEFAKSYKSAPCLADTIRLNAFKYLHKVYEVEDGDENSENSCKEAFNFRFPHPVSDKPTSANGLLFMPMDRTGSYDMYVCNPVTREYITIPDPENVGPGIVDWHSYSIYGFGVSRKSGQLKVVRFFDLLIKEESYRRTCCEVYTLGTGLWRSVAVAPSSRPLVNVDDMSKVFLNGNLHWLVCHDSQWIISCFDLETELFTSLSTPHLDSNSIGSLHALKDYLGICSSPPSDDQTVIWLMKNYGDEKSWTKQYVIPKMCYDFLCILHVFKDGDILLRYYYWFGRSTLCYSNKTKAITKPDLFQRYEDDIDFGTMPVSYTPSFLPLKTFSSTESISSF